MPETVHQEYELGGPEILSMAEIEGRVLAGVGARRNFLASKEADYSKIKCFCCVKALS
jgi:hypothetical protein